jgi:hypothetical protein
MHRPSLSRSALSLAIALSSPLWSPVPDAAACGMFSGPVDPTLGIPAVQTEQVVIVHDAKTGREHFVREVRFANVKGKLGFVVPLPSVPEIAKENAPFEALGKAFPFQPPLPKRVALRGPPGSKGARGVAGGSLGEGDGGSAPPPVELLAAQKVGSFTAFTLAARDPDALATWLKENGLEAPPEHQRWMAHYVRLGFTFVAFRFDGPTDTTLIAETVRLSFDTPVPFYPYLEPEAPRRHPNAPTTRLLRTWVITNAPVAPVAARVTLGAMSRTVQVSHVVPWGVGTESTDRGAMARALGPSLAKLLPATPVLQTYADTRLSRNGYGDILFAPRAKTPPTEAQRTAWKPLLPLLEPELLTGDAIAEVKR